MTKPSSKSDAGRRTFNSAPAGGVSPWLANGYNPTPARSVESAPMGRCVSATLR